MKTNEMEVAVNKVLKGVESFADEMKRKEIHVGLGNPPICVTCGKPWKECQTRKPISSR